MSRNCDIVNTCYSLRVHAWSPPLLRSGLCPVHPADTGKWRVFTWHSATCVFIEQVYTSHGLVWSFSFMSRRLKCKSGFPFLVIICLHCVVGSNKEVQPSTIHRLPLQGNVLRNLTRACFNLSRFYALLFGQLFVLRVCRAPSCVFAAHSAEIWTRACAYPEAAERHPWGAQSFL